MEGFALRRGKIAAVGPTASAWQGANLPARAAQPAQASRRQTRE
jgi:hypothetical protein